jgi:hypothetical protein
MRALPMLALCAALATLARADDLSDALARVAFDAALPGTSRRGDVYGLHRVPCFYLETENVTCEDCSWGVSGTCSLLTLGAQPPDVCTSQTPPAKGVDMAGSDIESSPQGDEAGCAAHCCATAGCVAWTAVAAIEATAGACIAGGPCCWLKSSAPPAFNSSYPGGIWSGNVTRPPSPNVTAPPTGVRNAVPLGGLGAGALELRGDGTFHELTFHGASPAGAAKYGAQPDMLLGLRVPGGAARALRTAPPAYAAPGVAALTYRGAYPVSRLDVEDDALAAAGVAATLFAYHHLVPGDERASATPAAAFTLVVQNTGAAPAPVSFFFAVPFGGMDDCARTGPNTTDAAATSAPACAAAAAAAGAGAWTFSAAGACTLLGAAGRMVFASGSQCGIVGAWRSDGTLLVNDASAAPGLYSGSVALSPVADAPGATFSTGVADDAAALWAAFAAGGAFAPGTAAGVTGGAFAGVGARVGGATASATVPPGGNISLTIVFAWHFPQREYGSFNVGQFYSTIFTDAADVAAALDARGLVAAAADAATHTTVWGSAAANAMPPYLADHLLNQFSHFRNMIFSRDGLLREHEANDCPDLDSVHNDCAFPRARAAPANREPNNLNLQTPTCAPHDPLPTDQRHLPYIWAVPQFEKQKSELYQACQVDDGGADDGMITENPDFIQGERCGGRRMGDTTTIWILEVLELWRGTNDTARLAAAWPSVVRGMRWQIAQSVAQGLPAHLVCTYDILGMERYNMTTFNGVLHLAAMKAVHVMGTALGDAATVAAADAAFATGLTAMTTLMWNSTYSYFRAYTGGEAIMTDCLYGQQVALAHGLGWLLPQAMVASHLAAELKYNANPYGLTTVTGRKTPPPAAAAVVRADGVAARKAAKAAGARDFLAALPGSGADGQDDAVWMGAAPTWSSLALALGAAGPAGGSVATALQPTQWELDNYRSRLRSMWDLTGLSTTGDWGGDASNGQPLCTSHCAYRRGKGRRAAAIRRGEGGAQPTPRCLLSALSTAIRLLTRTPRPPPPPSPPPPKTASC